MKKGWLVALFGAAVYVVATKASSDVLSTDTAPNGVSGTVDDTFLDEGITTLSNLFTGVPDYINAWADAITRHEGWDVGTRSYRNNNPGNLRVQGDLGTDSGGFGVFSTYDLGRSALISDLQAKVRKYSTWTLYQVMARYAPPSENNTAVYTAGVAAALGVSATTPVGTIDALWQGSGLAWTPYSFAGAPAVFTASASASDAQDLTLLYGADLGLDS